MATNLLNCTVTTYSTQEVQGDSVLGQNLAQQEVTDSVIAGASAAPVNNNLVDINNYLLVIEPLPGFVISAQNISIGGTLGFTIVGGYGSSSSDAYMWGFMGGAEALPDNISTVMIANTTTPNALGNKVVATVTLDPNFVMPANNLTINIDFDGFATEYFPEPEPEPEPEPGEPEPEPVQTVSVLGGISMDLIRTNTSYTVFGGNRIYIAQFMEDAYKDLPTTFQTTLDNGFNLTPTGDFTDEQGALPPVSQFNVTNFNGNPTDVFGTCIGDKQPTCYGLFDILPHESFFDTSQSTIALSGNPYNHISTTAGKIMAGSKIGQFSDQMSVPVSAGAFDDNQTWGEYSIDQIFLSTDIVDWPLIARCYRRQEYRWSDNPNDANYLSLIDHPSISPGDSVVPTYETFYIRSQNPNIGLLAQNVDVWSAITIIYVDNGESLHPGTFGTSLGIGPQNVGATAFNQIDTSDYTFYEYTAVNNQCHVDLSGLEVTDLGLEINPSTGNFGQSHNYAVKVKIPWNTSISVNRSENSVTQSGQEWNVRYVTKVFLNLFPYNVLIMNPDGTYING